MSLPSRRLSLGSVGGGSVLGDLASTNRQHHQPSSSSSQRSSSRSRRMTMGGAEDDASLAGCTTTATTEEWRTSRRAQLDEWRRLSGRKSQRREQHLSSDEENDRNHDGSRSQQSNSSSTVVTKKARTEAHAPPPRPPASSGASSRGGGASTANASTTTGTGFGAAAADNSDSSSVGTSAVQRIARIRQQLREKHHPNSSNKSQQSTSSVPPLPPSLSSAHHHHHHHNDSSLTTIDDNNTLNHSTTTAVDDIAPTSATTTSRYLAGTPLSSKSRRHRRSTMSGTPGGLSGGARRRSLLVPQPLPPSQQHNNSLSQLTVDSTEPGGGGLFAATTDGLDTNSHRTSATAFSASKTTTTTTSSSKLDTVEGAGLRSQVREMQLRVQQLEQEKHALLMSKAPLEDSIRRQQETWLREQARLEQEITLLKSESRQQDERYRDLELQHEAVAEQATRLRHQVRQLTATSNNINHHASSLLSTYKGRTCGSLLNNSRLSTSSDPESALAQEASAVAAAASSWSRHVQNDRDVADLKKKLYGVEEENKALRLVKVSVEKELHATKIELESLTRTLDEVHAEYQELAQSSSNHRDAEIQLQVLTQEHTATSALLNAVSADLAATKARAEATLEQTNKEHKQQVDQLQFEMSVLKNNQANSHPADADAMATSDSTAADDVAVLKARVEERDRRIVELEVQLNKGEELRRQMHNRIQELRGNIRVFVRTRPFLPSDGGDNGASAHPPESAIDVSPNGESLEIVDARTVGASPHEFSFDKVFPPSTGQESVFTEVADFVQSALDGYHVCLFSYGQTGSGKTHTMQGTGNGAMRGIIPRAVEQILSQAKVLQATNRWKFSLHASFLEIYNEELKDLLVSMTDDKSSNKRKRPLPSEQPHKLAIKRNREGKSYVENLTGVPIETEDSAVGRQQLEALMAVAARSRSVGSTKMNAQSSRSHSVFMLHLVGTNEETGTQVSGALNLCDLAGSERLDRSGANQNAVRLKETQSINKSLSSLGDVFSALAQGASHVPYRNSKLTYLLQDCLSGDGKALMFVNLSPTMESSNESLCSLRFAQRVNQVELGKPTKHIQYKNSK